MPPRDSCMLVCILLSHLLGLAGEQLGWQPSESAPLARRRADNLCQQE